jgi:hypothetical protein
MVLLLASVVTMCVHVTGGGVAWWAETLVLVCAASALWAAGSLYPEPLPRAATCGWLIASLDGLSPASRRLVSLALLARQSVAEPDPAKWDTVLVVHALEPRDGTVLECEALVVGATHYLAISENTNARELLQRAQGLGKVMGYRGTLAVKRMLAALDAAG